MIEKLSTSRLTLSTPHLEDWIAFKNFNRRNQSHLAKWETISTSTSDTTYQETIKTWIKETNEKTALRFLIKEKDQPQKIIGFCNFTQMIQGPFRACYLGYKIDQAYEGKGYMYEALSAAISYLFKEFDIHRVMANYIPANLRSAKLLQRLGFTIEGYAKNYLFINGAWQDHVLTALTSEEWATNFSTCLNPINKATSLHFREAEMKDCADLTLLMEQLGYPIDQANMAENLQKYFLKSDQKAWVAEENGQVVGCVATAITNYFHRPGSFLRIITLVVNQNCRGLGVGKRLIQVAEDYARAKGCCHVELTSGIRRAEAHCFYRSQNYTELNSTKKYFAKKMELDSM